jgi:hypothetical protein
MQRDDDDDRPDFDDVYDIPVNQVERPSPCPVGTYRGEIVGLPEEVILGQRGTPAARYTVRLLEPATNDRGHYKDVDPEALEKWLTRADGEKASIMDRTLRLLMWKTKDSLYRHVDFLKKLGIEDLEEDGSPRSTRDMIAESPGREALFHIKHRPNENDPEVVYAEIDRVIKLPQE